MPIDLINPPALITRRPVQLIFIDGIELFNVIETSITRGLDQDLATAQVTLPWGLDSRVRKYSQIEIYNGANDFSNAPHVFSGYVVDWQAGLWPGTMTLMCEDPMALCKAWYNPTDIDQHGKSDTSAVREVLETVGFDPDQINLGGVGKKIGKLDENSLLWEQKESALARIQSIDSVSLGWRTYALCSGFMVRRFISLVPTSNYVHHFQEGVDILEGSMSTERVDPANQIVVQGQGVKSTASNTSDAKQWRKSPYWTRLRLLKVEATDIDYLSTEEVSAWILGRLGKWLLKVDFSTHLDFLVQTGESVKVTSTKMEVDQVLWIQTVTRTLDSQGVFTQTFTCVSELTALNRGSQTPLVTGTIPLPGTPLPPPPITTPIDPSNDDILVDIGFSPVLAEIVIIADTPTTIYDISVTDNSTSRQGTIASRAWTITGGSPYPTSSTLKVFTFTTQDLAACSVQLDVVDSNDSTGTLTRSLSGLASSRRYRKLYTAATDVMEAFDGAVWRTAAPSGGNVVGVAPGPLGWNDNTPGKALYTADDLQTAPAESAPFAAQAITSEWIELDVNANRAAAGGSGGNISITNDAASTWAERAGPSSDPVLRVFISRYNPLELHVLTANGYYVSTSGGASWTLRLAADTGSSEQFIDLCLSHTRNLLSSTDGVRNVGQGVVGALLTGITAGKDVYYLAPHIRLDRFAAVDEDGNTWVMATDGATAFTAGAALPATAEPMARGCWRDGTIPALVYFAAGAGGLWKTVDLFATSSGYYQVRKPSIAGAGTGPWLMVGAGQLASPPAFGGAGVIFSLLFVGPDVNLNTYFYSWDGSVWTQHAAGFGTGLGAVSQTEFWLVSRNTAAGSSHSTDSGSSFTPVSPTGAPSGGKGMYFSPTLFFIISDSDTGNNGIFKSTDGGANWTQITAAADGELLGLALAYGTSKLWWIKDQTSGIALTGCLRIGSASGGAGSAVTGITFVGTPPDLTVVDLYSAEAADVGMFIFTDLSNVGVFRLNDDGSATDMQTALQAVDSFGAWQLDTVKSLDGAIWYAQGGPVGGSTRYWVKSTDSGATWTSVKIGALASDVTFVINIDDPTEVWALGGTSDPAFWHSIDSGDTWTALADSPGTELSRTVHKTGGRSGRAG